MDLLDLTWDLGPGPGPELDKKVARMILETAQSPNSSFPLGLDLGLGLGLVKNSVDSDSSFNFNNVFNINQLLLLGGTGVVNSLLLQNKKYIFNKNDIHSI